MRMPICLILALSIFIPEAFASKVLWTQYCQHGGKMKLLVHLDSDPTAKNKSEAVKLWLREDAGDEWELAHSQAVDHLTATALFVIDPWPSHTKKLFRVTCDDSAWEGFFRAEPKEGLKLAALSCHKDIGWPWKEAIGELIAHDPDLVFFSGD